MSRKSTAAPQIPAGPAPRDGGPTEAFVFERASASPVEPAPVRRRSAKPHPPRRVKLGGEPKSTPLSPSLGIAQRWFLDVVSHPLSVEAAVGDGAIMSTIGAASADELERVVTAGPQLSAQERLGIYHYAYRARLVDCLADDFPAVQYVLGDDAFAGLCRSVIARHPSDGPNLNAYGRRLAQYCAERAKPSPRERFVRELAELEWAMVEVFHAHAAPTFSPEALRAIPADRWEHVRLRPSQTVRILEFTHPVNRFFQAWRSDQQPAIPAATWSATAVYRQGFTIWRMDLTRPMADLLKRLWACEALGAALEAIAAQVEDQQQLAQSVMRWFSEWVAGGMFASLDQ